MSSKKKQKAREKTGARRRIWLAVLSPIVAIGLLEGGLRIGGFGQPTSYFVRGENAGAVVNQRFTVPFLGPYLSRPCIPHALTRDKPDNTYRVFVFGGSAARGEPNPAFSFARILEVMLEEAYPETDFEVINTAVTAINSHVVLKIMRDCRGFNGDLYIVYMGNNEVVGPFSAAAGGKVPSLLFVRASMGLGSWRTGQLITRLLPGGHGASMKRRREWGGMEMFADHTIAAEDPVLEDVYANFRMNLNDIVKEAGTAGVDLIVSTVAVNLKDSPPFRSAHRKGLKDQQKMRWNIYYREAQAKERQGEEGAALHLYKEAVKIDGRHAELRYKLGRFLYSLGEKKEAAEHFAAARDFDVLRFRADTRVNNIIRGVCRSKEDRGLYLVDAEAKLGETIPGSELFYEHVHLRFAGNYALARALFDTVRGIIPADLKGGRRKDPAPASTKRCAEALAYTRYSQCANMHSIVKITSHPPFSKEAARKDVEELKRLEAGLSSTRLSATAKQHAAALRKRPRDLLTRINLANLELFCGRFSLAEEQYRLVLDQCPDIYSRYWLGRVLAAQEKFEQAVPHFQQVLEMAPGHTEARAGLAAVLHRTGSLDEAIDQYRRILKIRPDDPDIKNALELAREAAKAK